MRLQYSIDSNKILLALKTSGHILDLTTETSVLNIKYNGDCATFSPDGTCVASIYGKFLKIWKANAYPHLESSEFKQVDEVMISPDAQFVKFTSWDRAQIWDAITGVSLLAFTGINIKPIGVSPNLAFVTHLSKPDPLQSQEVQIWHVRTCNLNKSFRVDDDVDHIAPSSDGGQLVALTSSVIKLLDTESQGCLAMLSIGSL